MHPSETEIRGYRIAQKVMVAFVIVGMLLATHEAMSRPIFIALIIALAGTGCWICWQLDELLIRRLSNWAIRVMDGDAKAAAATKETEEIAAKIRGAVGSGQCAQHGTGGSFGP